MRWQPRGKQQYYYRERKTHGKVHKTYVGRGEKAEQAAAEDEANRQERKRQSEAKTVAEKRLNQTAIPAITLSDLAEQMTRAALYADGYYESYRHWIKRKRPNAMPQ